MKNVTRKKEIIKGNQIFSTNTTKEENKKNSSTNTRNQNGRNTILFMCIVFTKVFHTHWILLLPLHVHLNNVVLPYTFAGCFCSILFSSSFFSSLFQFITKYDIGYVISAFVHMFMILLYIRNELMPVYVYFPIYYIILLECV